MIMVNDCSINLKEYSAGFLYDPQTKSVLLHKRDFKTPDNPGQWAFFGGLSEGEETPVQTFIREMKEELGIDIPADSVLPLCDYVNEERRTYRSIFFVKSALGKHQMKLTEGEDFDWILLDEVFNYDLTEKTVRDLKLFLRLKLSL
jgi:8-oxo-dGTP pyrophosphatase MutT (NUDIX family)